jgi:hypothetical protein
VGIVARIAYLSSDLIVSVQPAQSIESEFSSHFHRYAGRRDRSLVAVTESGVPEVFDMKLSSNYTFLIIDLSSDTIYQT